jgi:putative transcriptional regulator
MRSQNLEGYLLVAAPFLEDSSFKESVILVLSHETGGAVGLQINRELHEITFGALMKQIGLPMSRIRLHTPQAVYAGGPIEENRGFVLHTNDYVSGETVAVEGGLSVTSTMDIFEDISKGAGPQNHMLVLGYTSWEPRQLEKELESSIWFPVKSDPKVIFAHKPEQRWSKALSTLGVDLRLLSNDVGHA